MEVYNKDSKLSTVLLTHPALIPVVFRLGISLGVGDNSIEDICRERNIDVGFFLAVVNTFIDEEYFPSNLFSYFTLKGTIDYLEKTGRNYIDVQLPNIERHFDFLTSRSGKDNNLSLLRKFFEDMKEHFVETIMDENERIFPSLKKGTLPVGEYDITGGHFEIEEKLQDLMTFLVVHLRGHYDTTLCMAVVSAVFNLRKDVNQNNRIRGRILMPMIDELKKNSILH